MLAAGQNDRLQNELKHAQTLLVDIADQERAKHEEKVINLQMNMRIVEERYQAAKTDMKMLEKKLKRKNTDISNQKQHFAQSEAETLRKVENVEAKAKNRDTELEKMKALINERDSLHTEALKKMEDKLKKREERSE